MHKQPSTIIIARHGVRLDQNDKNWRANNPDPYDSPLSYGGWIQCQTLGARIDKELQALADQQVREQTAYGEDDFATRRRRRRRKIIIHSSPFRRCIQTSIAIAAGLKYPPVDRLRSQQTQIPRSSLSNSIAADHLPELLRISSSKTPRSDPYEEPPPNTDRYRLRIDPFLGEWLSPTYFVDIERPPSSDAMMQKAQAYQQLIEDRIRGAQLDAFEPIAESPMESEERENLSKPVAGLRAMALAGHSMPHRTRTTSFGRGLTDNEEPYQVRASRRRARSTTYSPPLPTYSLAPQDPIPLGYVPHARDACVDWQADWNSIDMGWGDGGAYPEEWPAMHIRFRQGLQKMLEYYENLNRLSEDADDEDADEDTDLVLILVTHQAGANALIRLLTGAPALHDIGTASLTLAVRRPVLHRPPSISHTSHSPLGRADSSATRNRRGSLDLGLADDWEMRIIASTEHLRYGSNPLGLNSPRLGRSPAISSRKMVGADSIEGFSIGDPVAWRSGSSGGTVRSRRAANDEETTSRLAVNTGLWGSPAIPAQDRGQDEDEEVPLSPRSRAQTPQPIEEDVPEVTLTSSGRSRSNTVQDVQHALPDMNGGLWTAFPDTGSGGLWGSSSSSSRVRAVSPAKRRWSAVTMSSS